jgi:preprotein translocase subunit SecA
LLKFLKNLLDDNARDIKKYYKIVEEINGLEEKIKKLSSEELRGKTDEFREKLAKGASLKDILPEAFFGYRE